MRNKNQNLKKKCIKKNSGKKKKKSIGNEPHLQII